MGKTTCSCEPSVYQKGRQLQELCMCLVLPVSLQSQGGSKSFWATSKKMHTKRQNTLIMVRKMTVKHGFISVPWCFLMLGRMHWCVVCFVFFFSQNYENQLAFNSSCGDSACSPVKGRRAWLSPNDGCCKGAIKSSDNEGDYLCISTFSANLQAFFGGRWGGGGVGIGLLKFHQYCSSIIAF